MITRWNKKHKHRLGEIGNLLAENEFLAFFYSLKILLTIRDLLRVTIKNDDAECKEENVEKFFRVEPTYNNSNNFSNVGVLRSGIIRRFLCLFLSNLKILFLE